MCLGFREKRIFIFLGHHFSQKEIRIRKCSLKFETVQFCANSTGNSTETLAPRGEATQIKQELLKPPSQRNAVVQVF